MRFRSSDILSFTSAKNYPGYLCGGGAPSPEDYVGLTHNNLQIDNVPRLMGFGKGMMFFWMDFFFPGCLESFFVSVFFLGGTDGVLGKKTYVDKKSVLWSECNYRSLNSFFPS